MIDMALFFCFKHTTFIQYHDYYCYCKKLLQKENDVVSKLRYKSDRCQICKIPPMFYDFERNSKKRFNMEALCRYYDRLYDELVKLFKECPKAAERKN